MTHWHTRFVAHVTEQRFCPRWGREDAPSTAGRAGRARRQNASIVDMLPSVSESPSVTMPPVSALASTSTPQTKNQSLVRLAIGITCAALKSPGGET
jgi:hypothetical protein